MASPRAIARALARGAEKEAIRPRAPKPLTAEEIAAARHVFRAGDDVGYGRNYVRGVMKFTADGMTPEARMARAKAMGVDTETPAFRGLNRPYDAARAGNYQMFTSSPEDAGDYGSSIVRAYLRRGDGLRVNGGGNNFNSIPTEQLPDAVRDGVSRYARRSAPETARTDEIAYAARDAGYPSVTINNVYDNAFGEIPSRPAPATYSKQEIDDLAAALAGFDDGGPSPGGVDLPRNYDPVTTDTVFDASRIRSPFATFDPARANRRDLLAATIPATAALGAGALAMQPQDAEAAPVGRLFHGSHADFRKFDGRKLNMASQASWGHHMTPEYNFARNYGDNVYTVDVLADSSQVADYRARLRDEPVAKSAFEKVLRSLPESRRGGLDPDNLDDVPVGRAYEKMLESYWLPIIRTDYNDTRRVLAKNLAKHGLAGTYVQDMRGLGDIYSIFPDNQLRIVEKNGRRVPQDTGVGAALGAGAAGFGAAGIAGQDAQAQTPQPSALARALAREAPRFNAAVDTSLDVASFFDPTGGYATETARALKDLPGKVGPAGAVALAPLTGATEALGSIGQLPELGVAGGRAIARALARAPQPRGSQTYRKRK